MKAATLPNTTYIAALVLACGWLGTTGKAHTAEKSDAALLPPFSQVEEVVRRHFAALPDYRPGDAISQSQVEPLFKQLRLMGWNDGGFRELFARVPKDDSFLIRTLRTERGRHFMRQVASYPLGYDRLDRLAAIPSGRKLVTDLVDAKGGYQLIEYMTTSRGGINLGRQLSHVPGGTDFNKPTGEIYTEIQLIEALHKLYEESAQRQ